MGTEFLVASLWGVVLVYWFWSRRPTTSDTVGVFRRELRVLEGATPTRVPPANRRCTGDLPATPATPVALAATALCHKRMEVRRRRRDVLTVLVAAVAVSVVAAALTRSRVAFGSQAACDLALACYVYLLVRSTRAWAGAGLGRRSADGYAVALAPAPTAPTAPTAAVPTYWPPAPERASRERPAARAQVPSYVPAHFLVRTVGRAAASEDSETYGDFDSYASLALAAP